MKKIYGLLGWPVNKSLSPAMHNAAFKALGIDAEYKLFGITPEKLNQFLAHLPKSGISGLNVTVPYKEKVLKYLDYKSPEVKLIGACNVIRVERDGRLAGYNTDGLGFLRHLTSGLKFNPKNKTVSIIGAGGAAKAVAIHLAKTGAQKIFIFDIVKHKSKTLVSKIIKAFPKCKSYAVSSVAELNINDADLLINATAIGMRPKDPLLVAPEMLHLGLLVCDLIYNPGQTKLLKLAKSKGIKTSNGLGMLLYQGSLSFKHFTAKAAPINVMRAALKKKGFFL